MARYGQKGGRNETEFDLKGKIVDTDFGKGIAAGEEARSHEPHDDRTAYRTKKEGETEIGPHHDKGGLKKRLIPAGRGNSNYEGD